ncbi:MAG: hypothetical protein HQL38_19005 [Alphaproteobacteria bacterium]|nr:hypothetical protein [Alphaproteobacteria bacterium]
MDINQKMERLYLAIHDLVGEVLSLPTGDRAALRREHAEDRFSKVGPVCGAIERAMEKTKDGNGRSSIAFAAAYQLCVFVARVGGRGSEHPALTLRRLEYSRFDDLVCARDERLQDMLARAARILRQNDEKVDPVPIYRLIAENTNPDTSREAVKIDWMRKFYRIQSSK